MYDLRFPPQRAESARLLASALEIWPDTRSCRPVAPAILETDDLEKKLSKALKLNESLQAKVTDFKARLDWQTVARKGREQFDLEATAAPMVADLFYSTSLGRSDAEKLMETAIEERDIAISERRVMVAKMVARAREGVQQEGAAAAREGMVLQQEDALQQELLAAREGMVVLQNDLLAATTQCNTLLLERDALRMELDAMTMQAVEVLNERAKDVEESDRIECILRADNQGMREEMDRLALVVSGEVDSGQPLGETIALFQEEIQSLKEANSILRAREESPSEIAALRAKVERLCGELAITDTTMQEVNDAELITVRAMLDDTTSDLISVRGEMSTALEQAIKSHHLEIADVRRAAAGEVQVANETLLKEKAESDALRINLSAANATVAFLRARSEDRVEPPSIREERVQPFASEPLSIRASLAAVMRERDTFCERVKELERTNSQQEIAALKTKIALLENKKKKGGGVAGK